MPGDTTMHGVLVCMCVHMCARVQWGGLWEQRMLLKHGDMRQLPGFPVLPSRCAGQDVCAHVWHAVCRS